MRTTKTEKIINLLETLFGRPNYRKKEKIETIHSHVCGTVWGMTIEQLQIELYKVVDDGYLTYTRDNYSQEMMYQSTPKLFEMRMQEDE